MNASCSRENPLNERCRLLILPQTRDFLRRASKTIEE
jgi:hypothetical protein